MPDKSMSERRFRSSNLGTTITSQGRTRKWVAIQAGVSQSLLTRIINGERTIGEDPARRISAALQVPFDMLFNSAHGSDMSSYENGVAA